MLPVQNGTSSGTAALPSSALATPAPSVSATAITSSVASQRTLSDQHRDPLAGVEDVGGLLQLRLLGNAPPGPVADARVDGVRRVRLNLHRLHVLHVGGHDHAGDGALGLRDPQRPVDQMADVEGSLACSQNADATSL